MQLATALLSFLCIQKNYTCTLYPQAYNSLGNYEIMAHNSLLNTHKWDLRQLNPTRLHSQKSTGRVRSVTCPLQDVVNFLIRDRWVDTTKQAVLTGASQALLTGASQAVLSGALQAVLYLTGALQAVVLLYHELLY